MIRKLKRDDLKKYRKIQEKGRKTSDLRPFGEKNPAARIQRRTAR